MKIYCATMIHESNSFSALPTSLASFRESVLYLPSTGEGREHLGQILAGVDHLRLMTERGHEAVVGLIANAEPSLPVNGADYRRLREEILGNLRAALPVDAVFLFLHGAQMADDEDDCESDVAAAVRQIIGPDVPIAVELDLHCNIGETLLTSADSVLACLEYPHIDFAERARLSIDILERTAAHAIKPVTVIQRIPMLGFFPTTEEPMHGFIDRVKAMQGKDGIVAISLCQGFSGGDTPQTCASVMVVADGDRAKAERVAQNIAQEYWQLRATSGQHRTPAHEALDKALAVAASPVVLADAADNPGGGAAGDSTFFLRQLLQRKVQNAALAMIWDPLAAQIAAAAGVGARLMMRIGGKTGPASGDPVDAEATVLAVNPKASQIAQEGVSPLGLTVALEIGGVEVVVNSIRQQTFSPQCFTEVGIDPRAKRLLIVKSAQHFHETFSPFASAIIVADGPPGLPLDYRSYPYRRLKRPIWPLDPAPIHAFGMSWS